MVTGFCANTGAVQTSSKPLARVSNRRRRSRIAPPINEWNVLAHLTAREGARRRHLRVGYTACSFGALESGVAGRNVSGMPTGGLRTWVGLRDLGPGRGPLEGHTS